jgi:hypothetical protein
MICEYVCVVPLVRVGQEQKKSQEVCGHGCRNLLLRNICFLDTCVADPFIGVKATLIGRTQVICQRRHAMHTHAADVRHLTRAVHG